MTASEAREAILKVKSLPEARLLYPAIYASAGNSKELQALAWLLQQEVGDLDHDTDVQLSRAMEKIHRIPECVRKTEE